MLVVSGDPAAMHTSPLFLRASQTRIRHKNRRHCRPRAILHAAFDAASRAHYNDMSNKGHRKRTHTPQ
jgi:hypothetical protein